MGTASYPTSKKTYTDETDKEDLARASVINSLQDEVQAIEEELGIGLKGSKADLVARLAIALHTNGAVAQGTSNPGSPVEGQIYYRTDTNTFQVYNSLLYW